MEVSSDAVRGQVEKILASKVFADAEKLKRFLRFTIDQTLENRSEQIKEYLIATEVYDREPSFDPRLDPTVRVQARKLRSKLEEFYATDGRDDRIIIEYPKGGYVPTFKMREAARSAPVVTGNRNRRWQWIAAALVLAIALGVGSLRLLQEDPVIPPANSVPSIAVLPFQDMSSNKDQEFFCDGITDEIINALAQIEGLKVVARTSTFEFKNRGLDVRRIGEQLNVTNVLEGSVRRSGDKIRVTAQLNDASNGYHLWSATFDKDLREIFQIQEEISQAIVKALSVKLALNRTEPLIKKYTDDIEAYTLYLKGRHYFNSPGAEGYRLAISLFEQVIERDPGYAPAYAGIAEAYTWLVRRRGDRPRDAYPKAKQAAIKALELDDSLAEGHSALGLILAGYDWEWAASEREFRRALELGPNNASIHHTYALHMLPERRVDEALHAIQRAQELDPLSSVISQGRARIHIERREFDQAIEESRKAMARDPGFHLVHTSLGVALAGKKMYKESAEALQRACELSGRDPQPLGSLGYVLAAMGDRTGAMRLLEELKEMSTAKRRYVSPVDNAIIAAGLGDTDAVFYWLDKAHEDRATQLTIVPGDYRFDYVRSDPRFANFLKKLRLNE